MRRRRPRHAVPESVVRQLKRRRWTRRGTFVALVLLSLSTFVGRFGVFGYRGDDWAKFDGRTAVVSHVVDGDTVRIRVPPDNSEETVRLLGIDAPETGQPPAYWGREATTHLAGAVEGQSVTVRLDATQTRDK